MLAFKQFGKHQGPWPYTINIMCGNLINCNFLVMSTHIL